MLEKIEVGKSYLNSFDRKSEVLFKNNAVVFYKYPENKSHSHVTIDYALKNWSEIPVKKYQHEWWHKGESSYTHRMLIGNSEKLRVMGEDIFIKTTEIKDK